MKSPFQHNFWFSLYATVVFAFASTSFATADVQSSDDRIVVNETSINGKPVHLAFDTGAGVTFIYRIVAERLGLRFSMPPLDTKIPTGETLVGKTEIVNFHAGGWTTTAALGVVDQPTGLANDYDGFIGWGGIQDNFFTFDFSKGKLNIDSTGKIPTPAAEWQQLQIRKGSKTLILEIPSSADQARCILADTGSDSGIDLAPVRWREWRSTHPHAPTTLDAYYNPGAGLVLREVCWAKELDVGPLKLTDVSVQEADTAEVSPNPDLEATMGLAAMKRQNIVVDGKNGIAYFSLHQLPATPFQHNRLGAVFIPSDLQHDPLEAHIIAGTPAYLAGVRDGDQLLKIDALDATKWRTDPTVMPLSRFWQRPAGTKLVLTLKRGDQEFSVTATLRDIIGPGVPK